MTMNQTMNIFSCNMLKIDSWYIHILKHLVRHVVKNHTPCSIYIFDESWWSIPLDCHTIHICRYMVTGRSHGSSGGLRMGSWSVFNLQCNPNLAANRIIWIVLIVMFDHTKRWIHSVDCSPFPWSNRPSTVFTQVGKSNCWACLHQTFYQYSFMNSSHEFTWQNWEWLAVTAEALGKLQTPLTIFIWARNKILYPHLILLVGGYTIPGKWEFIFI